MNTEHKKSPSISMSPQLLIFQLKRFSYDGNGRKNNAKIFFPLKDLKIKESKYFKFYNLVGVICHHGSTLRSGHYTSFTLKTENKKWYKSDDSCVTEVRPQVVSRASSEAYILFYDFYDSQPKPDVRSKSLRLRLEAGRDWFHKYYLILLTFCSYQYE